MAYRIFKLDPALLPYQSHIERRMSSYYSKKEELLGAHTSLSDFANAHHYFGFHKTSEGWVYREWAPSADALYLTGDMVNWDPHALPLTPIGNGVFELLLPSSVSLYDGCHVKTIVHHKGQVLERIPLYIRRVTQDPSTGIWCGVITDRPPYSWKHNAFKPKKQLYIYECHIGMAEEKEGIGTYREFIDNVLPRIRKGGYNTIQIMAIMEHPYYGSFGYQVSSFFAASSRYGTAEELKELIDTAHGMGIAVLLDLVHSHAVRNTTEGINEFDGTSTQFFHEGARGDHPTWGTKLFNYAKPEVLHFLLSNLKFWLEEFHFDGFRFDGITSMIYRDHALGTAFTDYGKYFSENTDTESITYLQLANELIHELSPTAITIAEDMSAMPGMCLPLSDGGIGFDYRLSMGNPDLWVRYLKEKRDEEWNMWELWHELTSRRPGEKYIGYVESHDQALVGDKTVMFRLCDSLMYTDMSKSSDHFMIQRGMALHKMLRLITLTLGGEGYLNFMGNEFGHPEWIDFPREGNSWSYFYCRRQWHLADDPSLKYGQLLAFDKAMIACAKKHHLFRSKPLSLFIDADKQILIYRRSTLVFAFNFNPANSFEGYCVTVPTLGTYKVTLSTDDSAFGGQDRISETQLYEAYADEHGTPKIRIYLPARTALVLERISGQRFNK